MFDAIEEMNRYVGHSEEISVRGAVFGRWVAALRKDADDATECFRENERLKMEIETLKTRGKK